MFGRRRSGGMLLVGVLLAVLSGSLSAQTLLPDYTCSACGRSFNNSSRYDQHLPCPAVAPSGSTAAYPCPYGCGQNFYTSDAMGTHAATCPLRKDATKPGTPTAPSPSLPPPPPPPPPIEIMVSTILQSPGDCPTICFVPCENARSSDLPADSPSLMGVSFTETCVALKKLNDLRLGPLGMVAAGGAGGPTPISEDGLAVDTPDFWGTSNY